MAMEGNSAFWHEPGIHSEAQVAGWKKVTDAVHAAGGRIVLQIWHGGRACHPLLNDGRQPVAPSALAITGDEVHTPQGKQPYVVPRELRDDELPGIVAGFARAAENARAAGFDGVEVHGANGYLLDEFLRDGSNTRSGPYGGPREHRARLLFEVIEAVCKVWGQRTRRRTPVAAQQLQRHDRQRPPRPRRMARRLPQRLPPRLPAPDARRLLRQAARRRGDAGARRLPRRAPRLRRLPRRHPRRPVPPDRAGPHLPAVPHAGAVEAAGLRPHRHRWLEARGQARARRVRRLPRPDRPAQRRRRDPLPARLPRVQGLPRQPAR